MWSTQDQKQTDGMEVSVPVGDERPTGGDLFIPVFPGVEAGPAPNETGYWESRVTGTVREL